MTVTVNVEVLKQLEEQIQSLQSQIKKLNQQEEGFEHLDSDIYLMELYNKQMR
ncbi:hypothetical protein [Ammoniphilus sp. CFH 90114]|uniref:hypothetical protein n=1 Tax=Ammoniphilus sp. CFH 90114 TaxID=2493665 RepID=UPI0013E98FA6|nr:hypothetical protein [Ammoniphilus sp. CFH 90114]